MVIATCGEHPWIATVYYAMDDNWNFYFLSDPKTLHCQHIAKNPEVALAIATSPQDLSENKKGVQIFGLAEQITEEAEITTAVNLWKKRLSVESDDYSYAGMMANKIKGRMYKVVPKKTKFFNEDLWEEGTETTIEL